MRFSNRHQEVPGRPPGARRRRLTRAGWSIGSVGALAVAAVLLPGASASAAPGDYVAGGGPCTDRVFYEAQNDGSYVRYTFAGSWDIGGSPDGTRYYRYRHLRAMWDGATWAVDPDWQSVTTWYCTTPSPMPSVSTPTPSPSPAPTPTPTPTPTPPPTCPKPEEPPAAVSPEGTDRRIQEVALDARALDPAHLGSDNLVTPRPLLPTFPAELQAQAQRLGFTVRGWTGTTGFAWLEDYLVSLSDGSYLRPTDDSRVGAAIQRARDGYAPFYLYGPYPAGDYEALAQQNGLQLRRTEVYFDGGNVLSARRANGQPVVITTESVLRTNLELRDAQGCFPADSTQADKVSGTRTAVATAFGVTPDRLVVLPQPTISPRTASVAGAHLDMAVRPGPDGTVFVDDVDLGNAAMAAAAAGPGLPADTVEVMTAYQLRGDQLAMRQEWRRSAGEQLAAAGLTAVGVPGYFYADNATFDPVQRIRLRSAGARQATFPQSFTFMNGLGGQTGSGQRFYLTASSPAWGDGAPVEHPLGAVEVAFRDALAAHGTEVTFLPSLHHLAPRSKGSIDCLTLERVI